MPKKIIKRFQKQYGKKRGKEVYYATAHAQDRDPETFEKLEERKIKLLKEYISNCIREELNTTDNSTDLETQLNQDNKNQPEQQSDNPDIIKTEGEINEITEEISKTEAEIHKRTESLKRKLGDLQEKKGRLTKHLEELRKRK
jgi:chromosome segregation ATPase